ncbi:Solute carrier family 35 member F6 [Coccomyxa sp. Obi]|nr:Solute carrier family 35 member F6 [Coccomyxa sp. Obi]
MAQGSLTLYLSVSGLLLFGTITSLFAKIVYELQGPDLDGNDKLFRKPWAMATNMFIGMSFCIPLFYLEERRQRRRSAQNAGLDASAPLLNGGDKESSKPKYQVFMLAIPTIFDLIATVLMNIGLLSVTASVYQMMRGAEMFFAAIFSVLFLHRRLNKFHLLGILCCVVGISLVGLSSVLHGGGSTQVEVSPEQMLLGMGLIVASQAVQAAQLTFEDYFMADLAVPALLIVGWEGVFGTAIMALIMLPIVYFLPGVDGQGLHENSIETLHMLFHSAPLLTVILVDMAALLLYNYAGMCVTGELGAVFRTVLETMRTMFVWLVDLLLFYTPLGLGKLGESWSVYSFIQAAGFAVLVCGTLVYSKGDSKEEEEELQAFGGVAPDLAGPPPPAPHYNALPTLVPGAHGEATTQPITMRGTPSSFKSTMNIHSFSYHRHGSVAGSAMAASSLHGNDDV